ncbi:MAG TPA: hypothetical protein VE913_18030 [Longimicrobium sp.]|nr:hypothetical protein [Longimicrobium sp.]
MTPQEKKRLSYLKDRRNTYGENSKSSRRNIARRKRIRSRTERRVGREGFIAIAGEIDEERIDIADVRMKKKRRSGWQKWPDEPLVVVLERKLSRAAGLEIRSADEAQRIAERTRERVSP